MVQKKHQGIFEKIKSYTMTFLKHIKGFAEKKANAEFYSEQPGFDLINLLRFVRDYFSSFLFRK